MNIFLILFFVFFLNCGLQDKQEIIAKFEHSFKDKKYLLFSGENPERLLIIFGSNGSLYRMWSWFYQNEKWNKTAYLFLTCKASYYWVGYKENRVIDFYTSLIKKVLTDIKVPANKVVSIGVSKGGYGAVFYAVNMNFAGAISICPLVDIESGVNGFPELIDEQMRNSWIDLRDILHDKVRLPYLALYFGRNIYDMSAANNLISVWKNKGPLFVSREKEINHPCRIPDFNEIHALMDKIIKT